MANEDKFIEVYQLSLFSRNGYKRISKNIYWQIKSKKKQINPKSQKY